ncbi:MAG: COX15/CtaA family protein [Gemmatimonadota bacterium]|nr:COX15/CtaA family protein [Gemmatimonadota bacterium]
MTSLRRLSYLALALAYAQIVFGALVRITGSGLGCGDHWPTCNGVLFPSLDQPHLVIEVFHRYIAAALILVILAMLLAAIRHRAEPGMSGRGGVLPRAGIAAALVAAAAVFGAATVKMGLSPLVIVGHLTIAMSLLATLASAAVRMGGLGGSALAPGSATPKAFRGARTGAAIALVVVVLGALTANLPGANVACLGFPLCSQGMAPGGLGHLQLTHRILAYLLALHVFGLAISSGKRREPAPVVRAARAALALVVVQILIAGAMMGRHLPPALRSAHEAVGALLWVTLVALTVLAGLAAPLSPTSSVPSGVAP